MYKRQCQEDGESAQRGPSEVRVAEGTEHGQSVDPVRPAEQRDQEAEQVGRGNEDGEDGACRAMGKAMTGVTISPANDRY